jgi:rare lipoprotein A
MKRGFAICGVIALASLGTAGTDVSARSGLASYYSHQGRTASGERFQPGGLTAAHPTLPFGTRLEVTSASTGRSVVVRINDRGPFVGSRVIDLSLGAAEAIGLRKAGIGRITYKVM